MDQGCQSDGHLDRLKNGVRVDYFFPVFSMLRKSIWRLIAESICYEGFGRPSGATQFASPARCGFDHRSKSRRSERLAMIDRMTNFADGRFAQCAREQLAIRLLPLEITHAERHVLRARRQQRVESTKRIRSIAAPTVPDWIVDDSGAHGIQFDVPLTCKQVALRVDQTGFVSAIPQRAGPSVLAVDVLNVAPSERHHQIRNRRNVGRGDQQMHVIRHQTIRMQSHAARAEREAQPVQVSAVVLQVKEAAPAIVSALHDVQRHAG